MHPSTTLRVAAGLIFAWSALGARDAAAQMATPCSSCASCTTTLAITGARAELSDDIVHEGDGPCIVIKGQDAQLDGLERDIRSVGGKAPVAIRVEASGVLVKNVHAMGADIGVDVVGAKRVTLFHDTIEASVAGVRATGTEALRVTRSNIAKAKVGVSFGADEAGGCKAGAMANVGAVVTGTHIEGAKVGVAACDALPVLKRNVIVRNEVGVRLTKPAAAGSGDGAAAPYDPCICKPPLPGAKAGTALFFSSGCHGCQVHEKWLPELKEKGHDILVRATGPENAQASAEFDAFMDQCAPQVTDAIGIPGCVPNYVCLANDMTNKMRKGENELEREVEVGTSDQLAAFEQQCRAAAADNYAAPGGCVAHQLHDNVICGNAKTDVAGVAGLEAWAGADNACGKVEGYKDAGKDGCAKPCPEALPEAVVPEARVREGADTPQGLLQPPPPPVPAQVAPAPEAAPPTPAPAAPAAPEAAAQAGAAGGSAPTPAPAEAAKPGAEQAAQAGATGSRQWMIIGLAALLLALVVGVIWKMWDDKG